MVAYRPLNPLGFVAFRMGRLFGGCPCALKGDAFVAIHLFVPEGRLRVARQELPGNWYVRKSVPSGRSNPGLHADTG
jgi:hypothetical protein